jgi:hypothetical protein
MAGDSDLLDFMDDNGVQCWPMRWRENQTVTWTAQLQTPLIQVTRPTLRMAVRDLMWKKASKHLEVGT